MNRRTSLTRRLAALLALAVVFILPAAAAAAAGEHVHQPINWFDFSNPDTPPLISTIINFLLMLGVVYLILRKPIGNMVRNRRENHATAAEEARRLKDEAEHALAEARARSESLEEDIARLRGEIIEAGKAESARIAAEAGQRAERMRAGAEAVIGQEVARVADGIRAEAVSAIVAQAEGVLGTMIRSDDHQRLSREFIDSLDRLAPPGER